MNVQHAIETPNMFAPVSTPAFAIGDWPKEEFKLCGITLIDGPKEESPEKSITYSEMPPFFAPARGGGVHGMGLARTPVSAAKRAATRAPNSDVSSGVRFPERWASATRRSCRIPLAAS